MLTAPVAWESWLPPSCPLPFPADPLLPAEVTCSHHQETSAEGRTEGGPGMLLVTCYLERKEPLACLTCSAAATKSLPVFQRSEGGVYVLKNQTFPDT